MKKDWQRETYRIIYVSYKGDWMTKYVVADNFTEAFLYITAGEEEFIDLWILKEISNRLDNGELLGKELIRIPENYK